MRSPRRFVLAVLALLPFVVGACSDAESGSAGTSGGGASSVAGGAGSDGGAASGSSGAGSGQTGSSGAADGGPGDARSQAELAAAGRGVYNANCIACHNVDPSKDGALGPAVAGSSLELLRARIVDGNYPEGYEPKRPTRVMVALPHLEPKLPELAAYLNSL